MEAVKQWFWDVSVWLPPGFSWDDFKNPNKAGIRYPEVNDLLYPIPCALFLLLVRLIVERSLFLPLGQRLGIRQIQKQAPPNPTLEKAFLSKNGRLPIRGLELRQLTQLTQMSQRNVQRWFRLRSASNRATKLTKFSECLWRGCCYVITLTVGFTVLWDKPWMWDVSQCWSNYPYHDLTSDLQWYYLAGSSLYISFALSQFYDVQRKDFWEMFIHHITTILLMAFSWITNYVRVGTIVLLLHDCADVPLEFAKVATYAKLSTVRDVLFGVFVLLWILTRLIYFPLYILHSTIYDVQNHFEMFPMAYALIYFLVVLFCLHIFWTWFITKILIRSYRKGIPGAEKDSRSSTESSSDDNCDDDDVSQSNNSHNYNKKNH